jgi:hypothetical protein
MKIYVRFFFSAVQMVYCYDKSLCFKEAEHRQWNSTGSQEQGPVVESRYNSNPLFWDFAGFFENSIQVIIITSKLSSLIIWIGLCAWFLENWNLHEIGICFHFVAYWTCFFFFQNLTGLAALHCKSNSFFHKRSQTCQKLKGS